MSDSGRDRHAEVIRLVSAYLTRVPDDEYAWQLLATSRYPGGDRVGALEAWNRIGRPMVDLVRIDGVREIRFRGIAGAMSVPPGSVLTPSRPALARRRVGDVPAVRRAAVDYQPVPGGIADGQSGILRIDLARSLVTDRDAALALGVERSWPLRPGRW